jgi:hypothetical protein
MAWSAEAEVMRRMKRMAEVVDSRTPTIRPTRRWRPAMTANSIAFKAACDLVFKGREQPSGYTEPLLHARRLRGEGRPAERDTNFAFDQSKCGGRLCRNPGDRAGSRCRLSRSRWCPAPMVMQPNGFIQAQYEGREYGQTPFIEAQSVHDGETLAVRLRWPARQAVQWRARRLPGRRGDRLPGQGRAGAVEHGYR